MHVLLKVYAKCIDGQDEAARRRIEDDQGKPSQSWLPDFAAHPPQRVILIKLRWDPEPW
ncbi:hypothetical protein [Catenuloplanes atrovinosus]|uniref:Uncharacterized protein n=1 Tax=Catenuloplanes atrovinosus TaxID=137266 RepID=A0AAE3YU55_9ACTN|nr:hypothetical protein [Catenuloplanes atrovinosus]MDR7279949.1 hypothetical protein [Catenuloplanes atrovinosus]